MAQKHFQSKSVVVKPIYATLVFKEAFRNMKLIPRHQCQRFEGMVSFKCFHYLHTSFNAE